MPERDVQVPSDAVAIDFEKIRDQDSDSWQRATEATPDVRLGDRDDLFVVQMDDSDDAHNLSLVEVRGGPYLGWCSCEGFEYHDYCAHLCVIRQRAVMNDHLVPTVDEDPRDDVDADVVNHAEPEPPETDHHGEPVDEDDQDDAGDQPSPPSTPAEARSGDVIDVEPSGSDADPADAPAPSRQDAPEPATTSDPFAEQLADDVPERFVMTLRGDTYIRRAGYARIARHNGLRLQLEEVVGAHETDWSHSKYRAQVIDQNGEIVVDGEVGSAHLDVEDLDGAEGELDELAATRAARRAIEWATGAGSTIDSSSDDPARARTDGGRRE